MKYETTSEWEAQEIDRAFDLTNMVFGAALGAYIGVVIAGSSPSLKQIWWLCGALVPLGYALFSARELAQILRKTRKGSMLINIVIIPLGLLLSLGAFLNSGLRIDVALALESCWFLMLTTLVGSHVIRRIW